MSIQPYVGDEQVIAFDDEDIIPAYDEAHHPLDPYYTVWSARAVYDHAVGNLSWPASKAKHKAECRAALGLAPPLPPIGALPIIRASGTTLVDQQTGVLWKWRGVSAFPLYANWLDGQSPDTFCRWARDNGLNVLRIFGVYCGTLGRLVPSDHPNYYAGLTPFLDAIGRHGLAVEWTMFADMQTDPLKTLDVQGHYHQVCELLAGRPGIVIEVCNEPFKNGLDPLAVYTPYNEVLQALGLYDIQNSQLPHAEYLTDHTPRDDEWPRKAKDILELTRGPSGPDFTPLQIPGICDEPMGIGVPQGGRRSMNKSDMASYHALAALFGSGSTIHGDFGLQGRLPNPAEQEVVNAITETWTKVPPAAQTWTYTAGHFADCPLVNNGLRTYGMVRDNTAVMVRVRPTEPPVAQHGWTILSQEGYQGLVVTLER